VSRAHFSFSLFRCLVAVLLLNALGFSSFVHSSVSKPIAAKGVIDLRAWNFAGQGPINLNGEYEFYWDHHVEPSKDVSSASAIPSYQEVPSSWDGTKIGGETLPGEGFVTYRLNILLQEGQNLALWIPDIGTAYRLLVDGREAAQVGIPGTSGESTEPDYYPLIVPVTSLRPRIELVFHVSNYHYRMGGIWLPIRLGLADQIEREVEMQRALDLLLFGAILIIGFYNLALFVMRREDRSPLYLGVFCLLLATRLLTVGDRFLTRVLPDIPFETYVRIEYLSWMLAVSAFAAFVSEVLPREFPRRASYVVHALIGLGFLFVMVTPVDVFSHVVTPFQILTIVALIGGTGSFVLAVVHRREGAIILTFAYGVLFYAVVNDILVNQGFIDTVLLLDIGLLVFIFFQSILISYRFTRSFNTIETQSALLAASNLRLQTQEKLRRQAESESETLQQATLSASRMASVKLLSEGISALPEDSVHYAAAIRDLLIIAGPEGARKPVNLNDVIRDVIAQESLSGLISQAKIKISLDLSADLPDLLAADSVCAMVRGLLQYHVLRGSPGTRLLLTTHAEDGEARTLFYSDIPAGRYIQLGIDDPEGSVLDPREMSHLFDEQTVLSDNQAHADGLTMGLVWCFVHEHGGGIDVLSLEGGGTRFEIYLPCISSPY